MVDTSEIQQLSIKSLLEKVKLKQVNSQGLLLKKLIWQSYIFRLHHFDA